MSVEEFQSRWTAAEREAGHGATSERFVRATVALPAALDAESRSLLEELGLPREAAPFLTFDYTARLPRLCEVFSPGTWEKSDVARLEQYRMLGRDGAGNSICMDERSGAVWLLDHEDHFRTRQFMNSSVALLAECLLANMAEGDGHQFADAVNRIDERAAGEGTFWRYEIANRHASGG